MGRIIRKTNCDSCGSSNNKCEYDDGSTWCFTPDCEGNKKAFAKKETAVKAEVGGVNKTTPVAK